MMELEDLDNINKNDFLPLLPLNIKQELLENNGSAASGGAGSGSCGGGGNGDGASGSGDNIADGSGSGNGESANICDSVEKQVSFRFNLLPVHESIQGRWIIKLFYTFIILHCPLDYLDKIL